MIEGAVMLWCWLGWGNWGLDPAACPKAGKLRALVGLMKVSGRNAWVEVTGRNACPTGGCARRSRVASWG